MSQGTPSLQDKRRPHLDEEPNEKGRGVPTSEGISVGEEADQSHHRPCPYNDWPLRPIGYLALHPPSLLVVDNGYRYQAVLQFVSFMPSNKGLHTATRRVAAHAANPRLAMAISRHGLYGPIAGIERSRLFISCNRPLHIAGALSTYNYMGDRQRSRLALC